MTYYNQLIINGQEFFDQKNIQIKKSVSNNNSTGYFSVDFDSPYGRHKSDFNLNQEVEIKAYEDVIINHYEMEDNSANTTIIAAKGTNATASVNTNTITSTGKINNCLGFNENFGKYGSVPYDNIPTDTLSLNMWVKISSGAINPIIFYYGSNGAGLYITATTGDSGTPNRAITIGNWYTYSDTSSTEIWSFDTWFMLSVIRTPSYVKAYVNGILAVTQNTPLTITKSRFRIGGGGIGANYFLGYLDEITIYSNEISQSEIDHLYNSGNGIEYSDLSRIFLGIIETINFTGEGNKMTCTISGRDYGSILQNILAQPRIFKNMEASEIILDLMEQNIPGITTNNVNVTTTTIEKITFSNISVFDAIKKIAEISGSNFWVDENKDLHFGLFGATSSGLTLDNTNIIGGEFETDKSQIYNRVRVYGAKQLVGTSEYLTSVGGSEFRLIYQPSNTSVYWSGTNLIQLQPGGVLNINDPSTDNVKYLVDYQGKNIIFTSGTASGDNIPKTGSIVYVTYQKNNQVVALRESFGSQQTYGIRDKIFTNSNIKDVNEAIVRANSYINEYAFPKTQCNSMELKNIINLNPGETVIVNQPFLNINNQTYQVLECSYDFNPINNMSGHVLKVKINKYL